MATEGMYAIWEEFPVEVRRRVLDNYPWELRDNDTLRADGDATFCPLGAAFREAGRAIDDYVPTVGMVASALTGGDARWSEVWQLACAFIEANDDGEIATKADLARAMGLPAPEG